MPTSSIFEDIVISSEYAEKVAEEFLKHMEQTGELNEHQNGEIVTCNDPKVIKRILETNLRRINGETTNNYTETGTKAKI